jgi:hypothetical protein
MFGLASAVSRAHKWSSTPSGTKIVGLPVAHPKQRGTCRCIRVNSQAFRRSDRVNRSTRRTRRASDGAPPLLLASRCSSSHGLLVRGCVPGGKLVKRSPRRPSSTMLHAVLLSTICSVCSLHNSHHATTTMCEDAATEQFADHWQSQHSPVPVAHMRRRRAARLDRQTS